MECLAHLTLLQQRRQSRLLGLTLNAGCPVILKTASAIKRGLQAASISMVPTPCLPVYAGKGEERSGVPNNNERINKAIGTKRAAYLNVIRKRDGKRERSDHMMVLGILVLPPFLLPAKSRIDAFSPISALLKCKSQWSRLRERGDVQSHPAWPIMTSTRTSVSVTLGKHRVRMRREMATLSHNVQHLHTKGGQEQV